MKKWDYIIIIICLAVVSIFCIFFIISKTNNDFEAVEVRYHNEVLEKVDVHIDAIYKIECVENKLSLYKDDVLIKQMSVNSKDFSNTFNY